MAAGQREGGGWLSGGRAASVAAPLAAHTLPIPFQTPLPDSGALPIARDQRRAQRASDRDTSALQAMARHRAKWDTPADVFTDTGHERLGRGGGASPGSRSPSRQASPAGRRGADGGASGGQGFSLESMGNGCFRWGWGGGKGGGRSGRGVEGSPRGQAGRALSLPPAHHRPPRHHPPTSTHSPQPTHPHPPTPTHSPPTPGPPQTTCY